MLGHSCFNKTLSLCILLCVGCISGCADKNWGYVTGTVTLNGQPIGPGSLMFEPDDATGVTSTSAIAHFGEDGKFELHSAGNRKGAPVGKYNVMVQGGGKEDFGDERVDPNKKSPIPGKYLNHRLSGLTAEIKAGSQTIDFPLEP
jgi:hypothetical protein